MSPRAILLATLLALAWTSAPAEAFSLRHRLVDRFVIPSGPDWSFRLADMNGDGWDDIVQADSLRSLCEILSSDRRQVLWDGTLDPHGCLDQLADATGDGHPDLLVRSFVGDAFWLCCYDPTSPAGVNRPRWRAGPFLRGCRVKKSEGKVGVFGVLGVFDGDGDGVNEVYVAVDPFVPGVMPRRLYALDGRTGAERWRYDLAAPASMLQVMGREGTGTRRLLVTTAAPGNGFAVGGETDSRAYAVCLAPNGRRVWSVPLGGLWCGVYLAPADLEGRGPQDIVAVVWPSAKGSELGGRGRSHLLVLDPGSGAVLRRAPLAQALGHLRAADLDRDGRSEIYSIGADQVLYCYGHDLRLRWVNRDRAYQGVTGGADLLGDGSRELACGTRTSVVVLDARGHVLTEEKLRTTTAETYFMKAGPRTRVAVREGENARIMSLEPPTVPPTTLAWGGGLLLFGTGGTAYVVGRRRRRAEALVSRGEAQDRLLEAMVAFGHSGSSLGVLDRLRFYLRNWERLRAQTGGPAKLAVLLDDFVGSVLPDLVRLVSLARRARVKPQHWRPLAVQALQVSGELQHLVEQGEAASGVRLQRAEAVLETLDGSLRGIRAHLRQVFRVEVEPLVRRVLARRSGELEAAGVEVRLEVGVPRGQVAFVAGDQLEKALENLVENATRAMRGSAPRRLGVGLSIEGAHCLVDVTDTGCGIPADDHERVFDRDYSSREGGGFGLYYARQVLARYEAKIFVRTSGPGAGTTFRVVLRTA